MPHLDTILKVAAIFGLAIGCVLFVLVVLYAETRRRHYAEMAQEAKAAARRAEIEAADALWMKAREQEQERPKLPAPRAPRKPIQRPSVDPADRKTWPLSADGDRISPIPVPRAA